MKELLNSQHDNKGFLRQAHRATALAGVLVALTACERPPNITDGFVYQKKHMTIYRGISGKLSRQETDTETGSLPLLHDQQGASKEAAIRSSRHPYEYWKIYCQMPGRPHAAAE